MASKDYGYISVGASQFGTATKQVYNVPAEICFGVEVERETTDPFYAARPDVAGKRRPFDLTEFVETAVPMAYANETTLEEPHRERRILTMKKRG